MKKLLEIIGIITLLVGSFMYTDKVSTTSKLTDNLLLEIQNKSSIYKIKPIEAIIENNTIIPGINGREVDIKASYEKMKEIGYFDNRLLVYKNILVKNSLKKNKDKYIVSANTSKKTVALLFIINKNDNVDYIMNVLNKYNLMGTFYINSTFLENNHSFIVKALQSHHTIGNLSNNGNYKDNDFLWMKTMITSTKYQKNNYCLTLKPNSKILNICSKHNSYTIMPSVSIKNRPFMTIKQNLKPGYIYALNINEETIREIKNIVLYINAKGYKMESLEKILDLE